MSALKVLLFDLETAGINALKPDLGFVICFGYKWLGEGSAQVLTPTKKELREFSDKRILKEATQLIAGADYVVAHYGSRFDKRFFQGRLLINNLPAPPPTKIKDTWEIVKRAANFSSNRLKYLAKILRFTQQKAENNWPIAWFKVLQGDMATLQKLAKYCKQDVLVLEELYERLKPYDRPTDIKSRLFAQREIKKGPLPTPCWIWSGKLRNGRYGQIVFQAQKRVVHQVAYEIFTGPIPNGLEIDHLCREPRCFNPKHLEPVTHTENVRRGVAARGLQKKCFRGHKLDIMRIRKETGRPRQECRTCVNIRQRRRRHVK